MREPTTSLPKDSARNILNLLDDEKQVILESISFRLDWMQEKSFREQVVLTARAVGVLVVLFRPQAIWWATFLLVIAGVLAAERNLALQLVVDRLQSHSL